LNGNKKEIKVETEIESLDERKMLFNLPFVALNPARSPTTPEMRMMIPHQIPVPRKSRNRTS
jgi:hypothetical protein